MKDDTVHQIKVSTPILPFLQHYNLQQLRKESATRYRALCPFHSEKTPSFLIDTKKETYTCFGCNKHGDVINFFAEINGITNAEAIQQLGREKLGTRTKTRHEPVVQTNGFKSAFSNNPLIARMEKFRQEKLEAALQENSKPQTAIFQALLDYCNGVTEEVREYLHHRCLSDETIAHFKLASISDPKVAFAHLKSMFDSPSLVRAGIMAEQNHQFLFNKNPILIPILENGEPVAIKARFFVDGKPVPTDASFGYRGNAKYKSTRMVAGKLFNSDILSTLEKGAILYLCEGEFDAMVLTERGKNAVSLLGVSNFDDTLIKKLNDFDVIVAFDNDDSGKLKGERFCERFHALNQRDCRKEQLPEGIKDITELFQAREGLNAPQQITQTPA